MHQLALVLVLTLAFPGSHHFAPSASTTTHASSAAPRAISSENAKRVSDAEIKKRIIQDSIDSYSGACACPYQRASNGSSCGRRSAYSRSGGYETLCYARDVSAEMVSAYRSENGLE